MFCPKCGTESEEDAQFCRTCGNSLAESTRKEAHRVGSHEAAVAAAIKADMPMRAALLVLLVLVGAAIVLGAVYWSLVANETSASPTPPAVQSERSAADDAPRAQHPPTDTLGAHTVPQASTTPQPTVPAQEAAFTSMIRSFVPSYNQADTEIRKTNVRFERKDAMTKFFSGPDGLRFQDWVGTVKGITTESDGEAAFSVTLLGDEECTVATWNNSFSDSSAHTMITRADHLYSSLTDIKSGDVVRVSGTFLPSDNQADYIRESSLTEEGSITSPDFIVRFTEIHRGRQ